MLHITTEQQFQSALMDRREIVLHETVSETARFSYWIVRGSCYIQVPIFFGSVYVVGYGLAPFVSETVPLPLQDAVARLEYLRSTSPDKLYCQSVGVARLLADISVRNRFTELVIAFLEHLSMSLDHTGNRANIQDVREALDILDSERSARFQAAM